MLARYVLDLDQANFSGHDRVNGLLLRTRLVDHPFSMWHSIPSLDPDALLLLFGLHQYPQLHERFLVDLGYAAFGHVPLQGEF